MSAFQQLICLILIFQSGSLARRIRDVTFGSSFKLINLDKDVRLHSQEIKYGSGSGQQSVTALGANDNVESHWVAKGTSTTAHLRGQPIRCGSKIRLEHSTSSRHLHSHQFSAPLSHHQEISAFGENGKSDDGDVWQVVCTKSGAKTWMRDEPVQLKHVETKVFLGLSGRSFGRPISGQFEVVGLPSDEDTSCRWKTAEGIFLHPSEAPGHHVHESDGEL